MSLYFIGRTFANNLLQTFLPGRRCDDDEEGKDGGEGKDVLHLGTEATADAMCFPKNRHAGHLEILDSERIVEK